MDEFIKRLMGEGPYAFPVDDINKGQIVDAQFFPGMIIITTKESVDFFPGFHSHQSYEFLIPLSLMPSTHMDCEVKYFEKNKLLPFNSEQSHGPAIQMSDCKLIGIMIDKDIIQNISHTIYGSSDIFFENKNTDVSNELHRLIRLFMGEAKYRQAGYEFILQSLINQIAVCLIRQLKSNMPGLLIEKNYTEKNSINRVVSYLREYYDKDYSLDEIAQIANLSPYHFIRIFKAATGKTPYDYLLDIKVDKAKELLKYEDHSITETCFLCGFNNLEHFASVFKRKVGSLPSQYKKSFSL